MSIFNAPLAVENHQTQACNTALEMLFQIEQINQQWTQKEYPHLHIRVGINSGNALVGNVGCPYRLSYTALGDEVNIASR
jgi:adenylate cyclase